MTVMPLIAPSTPGASCAGGPTIAVDGSVPADFAALVSQALAAADPAPAAVPATPVIPTPLATLPTAPSLPATTGSSSFPLRTTGLPPVAPDDEPEPATTDGRASAPTDLLPLIGLLMPPVPAPTPLAVADAPAPVPPTVSPLTSDVRGADSTTPLTAAGHASPADVSSPGDPAPASSPAPAPTDGPLPSSAAGPMASPLAAAPPPDAPPPPAVGAPATGVAVAAAVVTSTTTATVPLPASPVTAQVFPEVTRLVSTGTVTGTHRVTLQLNPAALGEVRVTLTIRAGVVRVSLAASSEAQASLLQGAPELRRLLELTGASDTRIVVRDLPTGTAPPMTASPPTSTDTGTGALGQPDPGQIGRGNGGDRSQDQHAGTRDGAPSARDGDHDEAVRPRPIDPTTRTRTSGVDVTM